jgi:alpha-glucosidase (family GH31 glycosyl hydrolase)
MYHRWVAFGLFSSHSRLHGSGSYRVPWQYGEDAAQYMAKFVNAKHRLMPYLYNLVGSVFINHCLPIDSFDFIQAIEAHAKGHPLQRAMFVEFPDDRTTHYLDRQYMLGPSLLVAPVFVCEGEETEYYIPEGVWSSFFHPEVQVAGPKWVKEIVPIDEIPVWVRPNTILCLGRDGVGKPDYELNRSLELRLYGVDEGVTNVPDVNGKVVGSVSVRMVGNYREITVEGDVEIETVSLIERGKVITKGLLEMGLPDFKISRGR